MAEAFLKQKGLAACNDNPLLKAWICISERRVTPVFELEKPVFSVQKGSGRLLCLQEKSITLIMRLFYTFIITLFSLTLFSQPVTPVKVTGTIIAESGKKPLSSATIEVKDPSGKTVDAALTDEYGTFLLDKLTQADGLKMTITMLGFKNYALTLEWKKANKEGKINLGKIALTEEINALDNVVVTGKRKAFEMKLDKRVFSPEAQITAKGGTAIDVLKNVPSLSVDAQGGVELRGSSPQIFVDGRPTILTLEQIPADDIEKIEVITNPSSKYDAGTSGGILNIVLKKNKARGMNGNLSAGVGYPSILTGYLGLNLRQKRLNYFVTGNFNQSGGIARGETNRTNLDNGVSTGSFSQVSYNDRLRKNGSGRVGVDYFMDDKNTFTVSYGISGGSGKSVGDQQQQYFKADGEINGTGDRDETYNWNWDNSSTQFLYKRSFGKTGHELTADFTYNKASNTSNSFFTNNLYENGATTPGTVNQVRNDGGSKNDQVTAQVDYVHPIGENEDAKFEAGLRHYTNEYHSFFNAFSVENGGESKLPFSNNIEYRENISAAYANYGNKIEKWGLSYQVGLRMEYSEFKGVLLDSAKEFGYKWPGEAKDFFQSMFPSLYLTKDVGEGNQLQFNYARRIRRPNFWQLNPFVDISDPLNIRMGNINLIPETVHSFELNFNREYTKGNFMVSAYYRNNLDDITRYSDTLTDEQYESLDNAAVSPNAILNTFINADFTNRMGIEVNLQHKFNEQFDIMPSVNLGRRRVKANVGDLKLDNEGFNWETQLTANYRVASKKKWLDKLAYQFTGEYESPEVIPQGRTIPEWRIDMALRKDFMKNNKASLVFSVDDVFNSRRWGNNIETPNFIQESYSRWNVRSFRVTFSLRFGSSDFQLMNKRKGGGDDDGGGEGG
jgi:outer membrane receptor protein involved in Fe transport